MASRPASPPHATLPLAVPPSTETPEYVALAIEAAADSPPPPEDGATAGHARRPPRAVKGKRRRKAQSPPSADDAQAPATLTAEEPPPASPPPSTQPLAPSADNDGGKPSPPTTTKAPPSDSGARWLWRGFKRAPTHTARWLRGLTKDQWIAILKEFTALTAVVVIELLPVETLLGRFAFIMIIPPAVVRIHSPVGGNLLYAVAVSITSIMGGALSGAALAASRDHWSGLLGFIFVYALLFMYCRARFPRFEGSMICASVVIWLVLTTNPPLDATTAQFVMRVSLSIVFGALIVLFVSVVLFPIIATCQLDAALAKAIHQATRLLECTAGAVLDEAPDDDVAQLTVMVAANRALLASLPELLVQARLELARGLWRARDYHDAAEALQHIVTLIHTAAVFSSERVHVFANVFAEDTADGKLDRGAGGGDGDHDGSDAAAGAQPATSSAAAHGPLFLVALQPNAFDRRLAAPALAHHKSLRSPPASPRLSPTPLPDGEAPLVPATTGANAPAARRPHHLRHASMPNFGDTPLIRGGGAGDSIGMSAPPFPPLASSPPPEQQQPTRTAPAAADPTAAEATEPPATEDDDELPVPSPSRQVVMDRVRIAWSSGVSILSSAARTLSGMGRYSRPGSTAAAPVSPTPAPRTNCDGNMVVMAELLASPTSPKLVPTLDPRKSRRFEAQFRRPLRAAMAEAIDVLEALATLLERRRYLAVTCCTRRKGGSVGEDARRGAPPERSVIDAILDDWNVTQGLRTFDELQQAHLLSSFKLSLDHYRLHFPLFTLRETLESLSGLVARFRRLRGARQHSLRDDLKWLLSHDPRTLTVAVRAVDGKCTRA